MPPLQAGLILSRCAECEYGYRTFIPTWPFEVLICTRCLHPKTVWGPVRTVAWRLLVKPFFDGVATVKM